MPWAGAAISYLFSVKPSVRSIGLAGPHFMQHLMERRKYPIFMMSISLLTILAGGPLLWFISGGLNLAWITTGPSLGFTIGSPASLVAFFVGGLGIAPNLMIMPYILVAVVVVIAAGPARLSRREPKQIQESSCEQISKLIYQV